MDDAPLNGTNGREEEQEREFDDVLNVFGAMANKVVDIMHSRETVAIIIRYEARNKRRETREMKPTYTLSIKSASRR